MLRKHLFPVLALSAVVVLLSLPPLRYGYLLDDYKNIRSYSFSEVAQTFYSHWEPTMTETKGYRPLHSAHQALFYSILGSDAFRHSLLQMVLAISGILLTYAFVLRCSGDRAVSFWSSLVYPCLGTSAGMLTFLFTRQHLVQFNLILLTMIFFDGYLSRNSNLHWFISFFWFVLALLLKEEAIVLPLILAAYAIIIKGEKIPALIRPLLPFFLMIVFLIIMRTTVVRTIPQDIPHPPPVSLSPASLTNEYAHSLLSTLVQTYGIHDPDNWDFPFFGGGLSIPRDYIGALSLLGFLVIGGLIFYRTGTVSEKRTFGFGLAVLLIGSVMVSVWYRNDRLFISSIGVAVMVGTVTSRLFRYISPTKRDLSGLTIISLALIFFAIYLGANLAAFYEIQEGHHPYGRIAMRWDRWTYEEYLPGMKPRQIEIFRDKLLSSGQTEKADRVTELLKLRETRKSGDSIPE